MRRIIKYSMLMLMIMVALVATVGQTLAYENNKKLSNGQLGGGAHRAINTLAGGIFVRDFLNTEAGKAFKNYDFMPLYKVGKYKVKALNATVTDSDLKALFQPTGDAVTELVAGARIKTTDVEFTSVVKPKSMKFSAWVIEGGFSADEPEQFMSMRHFYNPVAAKGVSYLTDLPIAFGRHMGANPQIDAVDWAFSNKGNAYSWFQGSICLDKAFSATSIKEAQSSYSAAWRSLGETMHLISDMTVPAHVRNDSHPGYFIAAGAYDDLRSDAYEYCTNWPGVIEQAWSSALMDPDLLNGIKQETVAEDLMISIAEYVNERFFSSDTIPYRNGIGQTVANNSGLIYGIVYDAPLLKNSTFDGKSGNYAVKDFSGEDLIMCHKSWLDDDGWDEHVPIVNQASVDSQARRLVPIAVKASERLMELFFPLVNLEVTDAGMNEESKEFTVNGSMKVFPRDPETGELAKTPDEMLHDSIQSMILFVKILQTDGKTCELAYLAPPVDIDSGKFTISLKDISNADGLYDILYPKKEADKTVKSVEYGVGLDMGGILVRSPLFGGDDITGLWDVTSTLTGIKMPKAYEDSINALKQEGDQTSGSIGLPDYSSMIGTKQASKMEITRTAKGSYLMKTILSAETQKAMQGMQGMDYSPAGEFTPDSKGAFKITYAISIAKGTMTAQIDPDKKTMTGTYSQSLNMGGKDMDFTYEGTFNAKKIQ